MVAEQPASLAKLSTLTHENPGPHTSGGTLTPHLPPQPEGHVVTEKAGDIKVIYILRVQN